MSTKKRRPSAAGDRPLEPHPIGDDFRRIRERRLDENFIQRPNRSVLAAPGLVTSQSGSDGQILRQAGEDLPSPAARLKNRTTRCVDA